MRGGDGKSKKRGKGEEMKGVKKKRKMARRKEGSERRKEGGREIIKGIKLIREMKK